MIDPVLLLPKPLYDALRASQDAFYEHLEQEHPDLLMDLERRFPDLDDFMEFMEQLFFSLN